MATRPLLLVGVIALLAPAPGVAPVLEIKDPDWDLGALVLEAALLPLSSKLALAGP